MKNSANSSKAATVSGRAGITCHTCHMPSPHVENDPPAVPSNSTRQAGRVTEEDVAPADLNEHGRQVPEVGVQGRRDPVSWVVARVGARERLG